MQFIGLICSGKCWNWHIFAIPSPNTATPPSNRSIRFQKRRAVPSTWRNCLFYVHLLGLGTAWHCHCSFFSLVWCVVILCLSITNAKTCNGEAVPSTWRNCFSCVDLLGLGPAGGYAVGLFYLFYGVLLRFAFYHHFSPMPQGICMPIFCSSAKHSSVSFVVDEQKRASATWFWIEFYPITSLQYDETAFF